MTARRTHDALLAATLGGAVIFAHQVAAKTTREALFYSSFPATALPAMTTAAALLSFCVVLFCGRAMTTHGPARLMPRIFWASALLHLLEWALVGLLPRAVAAGFYLHFALGAALISGFWLVVTERFDPHTAKQRMGRIVGAGVAGAVIGGVLAERFAAMLTVASILPLLAVLHAVCGCSLVLVGAAARPVEEPPAARFGDGVRSLATLPYLRRLMLFVLLCAAGAAMIDWVFKSQAQQAAAHAQAALQRFYALFYTAVSLLSFLIHAGVTARLLEKAGLATTASALPATVTLGGLGAVFWPGLAGAAAARASEGIVRNSMFRSAYELFYTPVLPSEKRSAKPLIDVGAERLGDIAGSAMIASLLWLNPGGAQRAALLIAAAAGLAALWVSLRLDRGYMGALEKSLRSRALELDSSEVKDRTTCSVLMRVSTTPGAQPTVPVPARRPRTPADPMLLRIAGLRSGDPDRVRQALKQDALNPALIAHAIPLLAWDQVSEDAARALSATGGVAAGQLVDALLDPDQEFAVRRRIPRLLAAAPSFRAVEGLILGLEDQRFEVRYRCGKALSKIRDREPQLPIARERVLAAVDKELQVDKRLWEAHRLLDGRDEGEMLGALANSGVEHVFTLLSLVLPKQPLGIAFRALHTDDEVLRGTALEYLTGLLPRAVQERLWPLFEETPPPSPGRSPENVLADLLRSNESVELRLASIKAKRARAG